MAQLTKSTRQPISGSLPLKQLVLFTAGALVALFTFAYTHRIVIPLLQTAETNVVAVESGIDLVTAQWKFSESELFVEGETVTITLANEDVAPHTFTIDELGVNLVVAPKSTQQITFNAPAGTYHFYCAAPGHLAVGMEGTLTLGN